MSRLSPQSASGLFVLIAGLAVVYAATASAGTPDQPASAVTAEPGPSPLQGVDLAVQRVLYAGGNAEVLGTDQLSVLPPEVARILIEYGAILIIPEPAGHG